MTGFVKTDSNANYAGAPDRWSPLEHDDIQATHIDKHKAIEQAELREEKEKKVRIVMCIYALLSMTFCQMSRMNLNVSIVEMVHNSNEQSQSDNSGPDDLLDDGSCSYDPLYINEEDSATTGSIIISSDVTSENIYESESISNEHNLHETDISSVVPQSNDDPMDLPMSSDQQVEPGEKNPVAEAEIDNHNGIGDDVSIETIVADDDNGEDIEEPKYPKFNWSIKQQNLLLGAFYMGYAPFMISGGILAQKYGSKYLILLGAGGSAVINFVTPFLASFSFELLVVSRIVLGMMQAPVFPSIYDLFSKWLTMTETSVFAPMIKVAFSIGVLCGSLLPGVIISKGMGWPLVFYASGAICFLWAIIWCFISTSSPQENRFVRQAELNRITRKKNLSPKPSSSVDQLTSTIGNNSNNLNLSGAQLERRLATENSLPSSKKRKQSKKKSPIPWLLILTSPSVLSLILVKFTYQLCLDFAAIELASYLKNAFHAPVKLISAIIMAMFAIQALFMVFVGILAKNMVRNKTFGWSKTTTRKVFQGLANFSMAIAYVFVSYSNCNITMVAVLMQIISFFWMFGAGGETMLPYDLSEKYPATIVGIAHSACGLSGLVMALMTGQILGDRGNDNVRWNVLLRLVAGCSFVGGLVFTLVAKAEPIEAAKSRRASDSGRPKQATQADKQLSNVYYIPSSSMPGVVIDLKGAGPPGGHHQ